MSFTDLAPTNQVQNYTASATFELPNGSCLKAGHWYTDGRYPQRSWPTRVIPWEWVQRLYECSDLGLWSSGTDHYVLAADFDDLPPQWNSWPAFRAHLKQKFRNIGLVCASQSGIRQKVFFVGRLTGEMNLAIALHNLQLLLGSELYAVVDKGIAACSRTLFSEEIYNVLSTRLRRQPVLDFHLPPPSPASTRHKQKIVYTFDGPLPGRLFEFVKGKCADDREWFLRLLLAMPKLASKTGWDLPTTHYAGLIGTSDKNIGNWIEELVASGHLVLVNGDYKIRRKGRTYRASGALLRELRAIKRHRRSLGKPKSPPCQLHISDNESNASIWKGSFGQEANPIAYLETVAEACDGASRKKVKERLDHARRSLRNRMKYAGFAEAVVAEFETDAKKWIKSWIATLP